MKTRLILPHNSILAISKGEIETNCFQLGKVLAEPLLETLYNEDPNPSGQACNL